MDYCLVLGDDMTLSRQGDVAIRQGTHLMDTIVISLGDKYRGALGRLEFRLPSGMTYASGSTTLSDEFRYDVPYSVTSQHGVVKMQFVINTDGRVLKSQMYDIVITSSVSADAEVSDKAKCDFFSEASKVINECRGVTDNANQMIAKMSILLSALNR